MEENTQTPAEETNIPAPTANDLPVDSQEVPAPEVVSPVPAEVQSTLNEDGSVTPAPVHEEAAAQTPDAPAEAAQ